MNPYLTAYMEKEFDAEKEAERLQIPYAIVDIGVATDEDKQ